jgi:hypothetical protein
VIKTTTQISIQKPIIYFRLIVLSNPELYPIKNEMKMEKIKDRYTMVSGTLEFKTIFDLEALSNIAYKAGSIIVD